MRLKRKIVSIVLSVLFALMSINIDFQTITYATDGDNEILYSEEVNPQANLYMSNGTADYDEVIESQEIEQEKYLAAAASSVNQDLVNIIKQAMYAGNKENVNLLPYNATVDDFKNAFSVALRESMLASNATTDGGYGYSYSYYGSQIYSFKLRFTDTTDEFIARRDKLESAVNSVVSEIPTALSDEEKVLFVHDYLVYNCQYDHENYLAGTIPGDSYSAYGALINGICVCAGYSQAFTIIMDKLGIDSEYLVSSAENHAWNLVNLDGEWYHLDTTFDDPVYTSPMDDRLGYVRHTYFLLNDAEMKADDCHTSWNDGYPASTSTKYSNNSVHNVNSNCFYSNGNWYYVYNNNLYKGSLFGSIPGTQISVGKSLSLMGGYNDKLVFMNGGKIYRVNTDGTNLTDISNLASISGTVSEVMVNTKGVIKYSISGAGTQYTYSIPINVSGISMNKTSLEMNVGENTTLVATVYPTNASNKNVKWNSSNTTVATVSTAGLVYANAYGTTTITATTEDGNKVASCVVTVNRPLEGTLKVDKTSAIVGDTITLSASASGGSGSYTYKYVVHNIDTDIWYTLMDYGVNSTYITKLSTTGRKEFVVSIKDEKSNVVTTNKIVVNVSEKLSGILKINNFTSDIDTNVGSMLTLSVNANGGYGSYTYKYVVHNLDTNVWYTLQNYGSNSSYVTSISSEGNKEFVVSIKDESGTVMTTNKIKVYATNTVLIGTLKINNSTNAQTVTVGDSLTLNASATGGSGGYTYKYVVHNLDTNTWYTLKDYSNNMTYITKISNEGNKEFVVSIKDKSGNIVTTNKIKISASKTLSGILKVNNSETLITTSVGSSLSLSVGASGGSGNYTYKYVVHNLDTNIWFTLKDYSASNIYTTKISTSGNKEFIVSIRDSSGSVITTNKVKVTTIN